MSYFQRVFESDTSMKIKKGQAYGFYFNVVKHLKKP